MNAAALKRLVDSLPSEAPIYIVVNVRSNKGKAQTVAIVEVEGVSTAGGELRLHTKEIEVTGPREGP